MVTKYYQQLFYSFMSAKAYVRIFIAVVLGGALLGSVYFVYRTCVQCRERSALQDFSSYFEQYQQAQNNVAEGEKVDWNDLYTLFKDGFERHKKSNLAPYFLLFSMQAALQDENKSLAKEIVSQVVDVTKNQNIHPFIAIEQSLMLLDSKNEEEAKKGLELLENIGLDVENMYSDMALFHLGYYYWIHDNLEKAREVWRGLLDQYDTGSASASPWSARARQLLLQID